MKNFIALLAGTLFSIGLAVSGMTDTTKVIGFLDLLGNWDASLMFVMGTALFVVIPAFYFIVKMKKPILNCQFSLPSNTQIDKNLIIGSAIFGSGWGLYGFCPGPAVSSLTYLNLDSFVFVFTMFIGMFLANKLKAKQA